MRCGNVIFSNLEMVYNRMGVYGNGKIFGDLFPSLGPFQ
jgi:hypothetical protein